MGGRRNSLSHRMCPPGLPGRRSRAAQALVAPAGAKLPRTAIIMAGLVFLAQALPFCCRPSGRGFYRRLFGEDGPMAGCCSACQEAQTAAGVRCSRFLPKTARRAPQALEAGAFWDHRPKSLALSTTKRSNKHPPPHSPRRELDPPEAPCQANRKEGAGHNAPPARPLEPIPQQNQPPNQASSNPALRLRLSPKQKNRAQAVQAALGERSPSD